MATIRCGRGFLVLFCMLALLVAASGCTGNDSAPVQPTTTPASGSSSSDITIKNMAFVPASLTVSAGTTVTWTNEDSVQHEIVSDATGQAAEGALFESYSLLNGAKYSFTFTTPGTYTYHCGLHPTMKGTVIVTA